MSEPWDVERRDRDEFARLTDLVERLEEQCKYLEHERDLAQSRAEELEQIVLGYGRALRNFEQMLLGTTMGRRQA